MGNAGRTPQRRDGDFTLAGFDRRAREGGVASHHIVTTGLDPVVHADSSNTLRTA
jgi:hypothetical protein